MNDIIKKSFDSIKNIKKEKREYREYLERIKALPENYRYVYKKITEYMWSLYGGGDGYDMVAAQSGLLKLFETGVAESRDVLEITGEDVAVFCDELLRSVNIRTDNLREKLNRDIHKKLKK